MSTSVINRAASAATPAPAGGIAPNSGAASSLWVIFLCKHVSPSNELDPPPLASNADPLVTVREIRLGASDNYPPRRYIEVSYPHRRPLSGGTLACDAFGILVGVPAIFAARLNYIIGKVFEPIQKLESMTNLERTAMRKLIKSITTERVFGVRLRIF
ncbi:hypothetical protein C8J57DRAFT_1222614 [Mycena rebaudengoi]|nr:hypothetical protein C8J57DRAFT_1222614 [Mycena rebaudengoi]